MLLQSPCDPQVAWNGAAWVLRDCGSSNGTAVNGQKLQPMGAHINKLVTGFGNSAGARKAKQHVLPYFAVDAVALKEGDQILFGLDSRGTVKVRLWRTVVARPEWCTSTSHKFTPSCHKTHRVQRSEDPMSLCQQFSICLVCAPAARVKMCRRSDGGAAPGLIV